MEKDTIEASVSADLPKELFGKKETSCGPNLDKREWMGKLFSSRLEPDKLFIDGVHVPLEAESRTSG